MANTKKAVAKKSTPATVKKVVKKTSTGRAEILENLGHNEPAANLERAPIQKGDPVLVNTPDGLQSATVIAVHAGNRVEVVVNGPKPYSPGTLKHKDDAGDSDDFWIENDY